jgi:uncharacterized protein (DUF849 family)
VQLIKKFHVHVREEEGGKKEARLSTFRRFFYHHLNATSALLVADLYHLLC